MTLNIKNISRAQKFVVKIQFITVLSLTLPGKRIEMTFPRAGKSAETLIAAVYRNVADVAEGGNNVLDQKTEMAEAL